MTGHEPKSVRGDTGPLGDERWHAQVLPLARLSGYGEAAIALASKRARIVSAIWQGDVEFTGDDARAA